MKAFRVSISVLVVVCLLVGCGDDGGEVEAEALEQARIFHETRDLMDVVIARTLFSVPDERDRLIQLEVDNGRHVSGARSDVDAFMRLGQVSNRVNGIRRELQESGKYLPEIDPQYR